MNETAGFVPLVDAAIFDRSAGSWVWDVGFQLY